MMTPLAAVPLLAIVLGAGDELVLAGADHATVIVRADDWKPSAWYDWGAHAILERFLGLATGTKIPVVSARQMTDAARAQYQTRIWVGRQPEVDRVLGAELDRLDDDGFMIRAVGGDVYLAGKHWWGDPWAAHDLLERFAGCRWYGPEPAFWKPKEEGMVGLFDIIPRRDQVTIPAGVRIAEEPGYKMRFYRFMPIHSFRLRYRDAFHHALSKILPPQELGTTHPDYFPLIDGRRRVPEPGHEHQFQPCVSHPEVVERVAQAAIAHFRANPRAGSFSVGMNDTDAFCECEACLKVAPKEITERRQRLAYAFFDFYNRVAQRVASEYPDRRLGCLAYAGLSGLPAGSIRLDPRIVPYLTRDSAQLFDADEVREFRETVDRWKGLATRMGIYEYIYGGGFVVPRIYHRYLIRNVRERYGVGVDGFYAEAYPNWGLDGPKYWLLARMLWNPDQDPEILLAQWHDDLFGRAAKPMREYFDYLEETWCTQTLDSDRSNYRWFLDPRQLEIFAPEKCETAWAMLDAARRQTDDPAVLRRIDYFRDTFAVTRALSRRYAAAAEFDRTAGEPPGDDMPGWLKRRRDGLQGWLEAPDPHAALRQAPPGALDTNVASDLSRYDRHPVDGAAAVVESLVALAIDRPDESSRALAALGSPGGRAEAMLRSLAEAGVLKVPRAVAPPEIDGRLEPGEWPPAAFTGRFYRVHRLEPQEETTAVFATWGPGTLYLAFDCRQDPATVAANVKEADRGGWREPAMLRDDCVNLTFRKAQGGFRSIRINAAGALGFHEATWNGVTGAAAGMTATGWQAELALATDKLGIDLANPGGWTLAVARYRRPAQGPADAPSEAFTLLPSPHGRGIIGNGNHPGLMTFITGPRLVFDDLKGPAR